MKRKETKGLASLKKKRSAGNRIIEQFEGRGGERGPGWDES